MTNLSPAAQAVASAYDDTPEKDTGNHRYFWLAAALRAAVAYTQQYQGNDCFSDEVWTCDADELLAIVNELEAHG